MKFLVFISLLSIGILEASGQSPSVNGDQNSQDNETLIVHANGIPITISERSDSPNTQSSSRAPIEVSENNSVVINTDDQVFARSRASANFTSTWANFVNRLMRKPLQALGLNRPGSSGNPNDLITQIITTQINAFAQTIANSIRDRLQQLWTQPRHQRNDNPGTEVEVEITVLELLHQFFSRPQLILQLLSELIPQSSAENSRQFAFPLRSSNSTLRNKRCRGVPCLFNKIVSKFTTTTTTTTTTTRRPLFAHSKKIRIVNSVLNALGLRAGRFDTTRGGRGATGDIRNKITNLWDRITHFVTV